MPYNAHLYKIVCLISFSFLKNKTSFLVYTLHTLISFWYVVYLRYQNIMCWDETAFLIQVKKDAKDEEGKYKFFSLRYNQLRSLKFSERASWNQFELKKTHIFIQISRVYLLVLISVLSSLIKEIIDQKKRWWNVSLAFLTFCRMKLVETTTKNQHLAHYVLGLSVAVCLNSK